MFGLGKKKGESKSCYCGKDCDAEKMKQAKAAQKEGAYIKILGSGCTKCNELEANTKKALEELGMDIDIDHITDFTQIASYGVMSTPALVIDSKVVAYGKVLKTEEVVKLLKKARE